MKFSDICFHCGREDSLKDDPYMDDMRERYSVMRPICSLCFEAGKVSDTRAAKLLANKLPPVGGDGRLLNDLAS